MSMTDITRNEFLHLVTAGLGMLAGGYLLTACSKLSIPEPTGKPTAQPPETDAPLKRKVKRVMNIATLHPDMIAEYERLHNQIPPQIVKNLSESGYTELRIYRQGTTLLMYMEWDEAAVVSDRVFDAAAEEEWQQVTGACFEKRWEEVPEIFSLTANTPPV
jgi:L-rhamnose mutarotase